MLSKKYYEVFAQILGQSTTKEEIVGKLCGYFAEDNPNFLGMRFINRIVEWENTPK